MSTFTFDDGNAPVVAADRVFKARKQKYRFSIVRWPLDENGRPDFSTKSGLWTSEKQAFIPKIGKIRVPDGAGLEKFLTDPAKRRYATMGISWPMNDPESGDFGIDEAAVAKGRFKIYTLSLPETSYAKVLTQYKACTRPGKFAEMDILIDCEDEGFQKMAFATLDGNFFRNIVDDPQLAKLADKILRDVVRHAADFDNDLGASYTAEELGRRIQATTGAPTGATATASPTATTAAAAAALSNLLD